MPPRFNTVPRGQRTWVRTSLAVALACASGAPVAAQSRGMFVPSISIGTVHDDNLFSTRRAVDDYLTQLRPTLEGIFKSPTVDIRSEANFDMQLSARHAALNTFDARRHAMFDGKLQRSPALGFGLVGRYDASQTPSELNLETGIILPRQRAQRVQLTPSLSYRTTPRTTVTTQYDWTTESLSTWAGGDLHVARFAVARQLSARTTLSAHYLGRLFVDHEGLRGPAPSVGIAIPEEALQRPSLPAETRWSQTVMLGWSRQLTPLTRMSLQAGPRLTSYRGLTSEILATVVRRTPHSRFLTDYWHGETIVLGILGPVRTHSGTMKWTRTVRRNLDLGVNLGAFRSMTIDRATARVLHAAATGAWLFGDHYILTASYGADFQQGDIRSTFMSNERIRRGVFLVRLTIRPRPRAGVELPEDPESPSIPVKGVIK